MIWCVEDDSSIRDIEVYALSSTGFEAISYIAKISRSFPSREGGFDSRILLQKERPPSGGLFCCHGASSARYPSAMWTAMAPSATAVTTWRSRLVRRSPTA